MLSLNKIEVVILKDLHVVSLIFCGLRYKVRIYIMIETLCIFYKRQAEIHEMTCNGY